MPGIQIGPLTVRYYGIIIMFGAVLAAVLTEREARRRGYNPDLIWDMFPWLLLGGIIGARLWHVFTPSRSMGITALDYLRNPLDILMIWKGGLGIPGAVIGGAIALWIYSRVRKLHFADWVDMIAPGLALAQAIGRWGNFVNQEVYGAPTNLPWAIYIDEAHRLPEFRDIAYYHPLFLYEFIWNLGNMALLLWLSRRKSKWLLPGDVFLIYLIVYPVGRFLLEFLRLDTSLVGSLNINQTIMGVIAVLATLALILRHRFGRRPVETVASAAPAPEGDALSPEDSDVPTTN